MKPSRNGRRAAVEAEEDVHLGLVLDGWEVHRNGWPDFLCVLDGQVMVIEVKSGMGKLSKEQCKVMNVLAFSGISCYVWHPSRGLSLYQEGKRPTLPRMYGAPRDKYPKAFSERVWAEHRRVTDKGLTGPRPRS